MKPDVDAESLHGQGSVDSDLTQHDSSPSSALNRSLRWTGALLLLVPVVMYFAFIHAYGVNAIYYDQWDNIGLLTHTRYLFDSYSHTTLAGLWAQHGEDRLFFPNLVVLALGHLTNMNILTELYISGTLLVVALALVIVAHRQDVPTTRLLFYLPVAFLVLTLGQNENTLFGFNLWLYMVIASLAATIFLLDLQEQQVGGVVFAAAIIVAVVGSYSALDGLAIWPAGLVILLWRRRPRRFVLTWCVSAAVTAVVLFYDYHLYGTGAGGGGSGYVFTHPLLGSEFFFYLVGNLTGGRLPLVGGSDPAIIAMGIAIVLLAVTCLAVAVHGRQLGLSRSPVGPALICFGILLAVVVAVGRSSLGLAGAEQSRYVTEDLLILVGCYLCLLEGWPALSRRSVPAAPMHAFKDGSGFRPMPIVRGRELIYALRVIAIVFIVVEVAGGVENGFRDGPASRSLFLRADLVAAHAACAPDALIKSALFPNQGYAWSNVRALAVAARRNRLSFFATSQASRFEHMRLPGTSNPIPQTRVLKPADEATLRGSVFLVASASTNCAIQSVHFQIDGMDGQRDEVLPTAHSPFGYLADWSTTHVPNGPYTLQSTVRDVEGHTGTSRPVVVNVRN